MYTVTSYDCATALINKWICNFDIPEVILTDQGPQVFLNVCMFLGIEKRRTTAYNPKCNGLVERMHGTMKQILATKVT